MIRPGNAAVAEAFEAWMRGANLRRVERVTGIGHTSLYNYMSGAAQIPVCVLAPVYQSVPDLDGLAHTIGLPELGLQLVPAPNATGSVDALISEGLRVGQSAGAVQGEIVAAIASGDVDEVEAAAIRRRIDSLKAEIAKLEAIANSPTLRAVGARR